MVSNTNVASSSRASHAVASTSCASSSVASTSSKTSPLQSLAFLSIVDLEKQISTLAKEGDTIREKTPVIRQWPWVNGIPLHHGSMKAYLSNHLESETQIDEFKDLILVCGIT